jgi:hypothetical protein
VLLTVQTADDATAGHDSLVLVAAEGLEGDTTRKALLHLAANLRSGVVVAEPDESVPPKMAGDMLGVSRQLGAGCSRGEIHGGGVDVILMDNIPATPDHLSDWRPVVVFAR